MASILVDPNLFSGYQKILKNILSGSFFNKIVKFFAWELPTNISTTQTTATQEKTQITLIGCDTIEINLVMFNEIFILISEAWPINVAHARNSQVTISHMLVNAGVYNYCVAI